ncbi:alpha/beta fold hydrolase [Mycobacterium sp. MS1601]|uniref:alpha/beta fold hydrolase n=1 Tax=Mycobacterium sp. MS1601 TaxID=1936029 RepID=UPI001F3CD3CB|nr:alpha/beta hydrolase [Mycobacterium sp. MS1601]
MPTVVLVHGAFADASSYQPVTRALLDAATPVVAVAVPNRSLLGDAAMVRAAINSIEGPVVLVGHSYGGAVITVAGAAANVVALVYLAGYALTEGESLAELQGQFPDSELPAALLQTPYPATSGGIGGIDVSVVPSMFPAVVAADVDPALAEVLAASQRPLSAAAFTEKATEAAWRDKPAWAVVCTADKAINPDVQRFGYGRAGATVREIDSSHLVMLSQPKMVVDLIEEVIAAVA